MSDKERDLDLVEQAWSTYRANLGGLVQFTLLHEIHRDAFERAVKQFEALRKTRYWEDDT